MEGVMNTVRGMDMFAKPITVTYRGKQSFPTVTGGCMSLCLYFVFLIYAAITLKAMMINPVLTDNSEMLYFSLYGNTNQYNIDARNSSLAISTSDASNENFRVVFWQFNATGQHFIPAVNCTDYYLDEMLASSAYDGFFTGAFRSKQFVCPDISQF